MLVIKRLLTMSCYFLVNKKVLIKAPLIFYRNIEKGTLFCYNGYIIK